MRNEVKLDWFPDCEDDDVDILLVGNVMIPWLQVKSTITMMSSTLLRVVVQVRLRAVPAYMTWVVSASTDTLGGGTVWMSIDTQYLYSYSCMEVLTLNSDIEDRLERWKWQQMRCSSLPNICTFLCQWCLVVRMTVQGLLCCYWWPWLPLVPLQSLHSPLWSNLR